MKEIEIKIINESDNDYPKYCSLGAAGMDILADKFEIIAPNTSKLIKTGLRVEIPEGFEIQIRPRSGLALNFSVTVLNSPGTIDSDYRGEIGVILINHGEYDFFVEKGERIAQLVLNKVEKIKWVPSLFLTNTVRNSEGFGSTGMK